MKIITVKIEGDNCTTEMESCLECFRSSVNSLFIKNIYMMSWKILVDIQNVTLFFSLWLSVSFKDHMCSACSLLITELIYSSLPVPSSCQFVSHPKSLNYFTQTGVAQWKCFIESGHLDMSSALNVLCQEGKRENQGQNWEKKEREKEKHS